jgi:HAD superfamily hydrolase (TIGR01509 family)
VGVADRPALVIFDCDGVLVDSEVISNDVLARLLTEAGLPTTLPEARRDYQGLLLSEVVDRASHRLGRPLGAGWLEHYVTVREAAFRSELRAVPGAAEAVRRVRAGGSDVCVASQGALTKTQTSLGITGLDGLFSAGALFSAEAVPRGKPSPDLFLHAAATMGAAAVDCVVVEDTVTGVAAAVAAGMRVLGFTADSDEAALRAAGAEVFAAMEELPGRLGVVGG